jgi:hypothetical protein
MAQPCGFDGCTKKSALGLKAEAEQSLPPNCMWESECQIAIQNANCNVDNSSQRRPEPAKAHSSRASKLPTQSRSAAPQQRAARDLMRFRFRE